MVLMWLVTKSVAAEMKKIMSSANKPAFDGMTIEELNIGGKIFKVLIIDCKRWRGYVTVNSDCFY